MRAQNTPMRIMNSVCPVILAAKHRAQKRHGRDLDQGIIGAIAQYLEVCRANVPSSMRAMLHILLATVAAAAGIAPHAAAAEPTQEPDPINWYYSAAFGTGVYRVGDETVTAIRLPFSRTLRQPDGDSWGLRLLYPVTLGYYDFDFGDVADLLTPENVSTLSVLPGVEWTIPLSSRWSLRPFAQLGAGSEFSGDVYATIYAIGAKSRFTLPRDSWEFILGNQLIFAGYDSSEDERRAMSTFATSFNFLHRLDADILGRGTDLGVHFVHYFNFNEVDFERVLRDPLEVRHEFELALTMGLRRPISLTIFKLSRLGIGIRLSEDLSAVRLIGGVPY